MKITEAQFRKAVREHIRQELEQRRLEEDLGSTLKGLWGKITGKKPDAQAAPAGTTAGNKKAPGAIEKMEAQRGQIDTVLKKSLTGIGNAIKGLGRDVPMAGVKKALMDVGNIVNTLQSSDVVPTLLSRLMLSLGMNIDEEGKQRSFEDQMQLFASDRSSRGYNERFQRFNMIIGAIKEILKSNGEGLVNDMGAREELFGQLQDLQASIGELSQINAKQFAARIDRPRRKELSFENKQHIAECKKYMAKKVNKIIAERTMLRKLGMLYS